MSLTVRQANPGDCKDVYKITKAAFKEYSKRACPQAANAALSETENDVLYDIENKYVFLAELDGKPVGSIRIEIDGGYALLSRFGVLNGYRSSGCGNLLISEATSLLKSKGIKMLYLYTASKASTLMRYYYGRGFYVKNVDDKKGYIRVKMAKEI